MNRADKEVMIGSPIFPLAKGVNGRFLKRRNGRTELVVIIDDDMSAQELREAWGSIDTVRTHLRRFQGSNMQNVHNALIYSYAQMKNNGWSYRTIAMDINYDCIVNLCRVAEEKSDLDAPMIMSVGFSYAVTLLRVMRMKDEDIVYWLIPGLREIHGGHAPWPLDGGPVDGQRVRDALRQWEREREVEKVVVKAPPKTKYVSVEVLALANKIPNQKARELLERSYPESLAKYDEQVKRILENSGFSGAVHAVE